ncbi:4'-phosphopantetheinyl transferase family protein [Brachybacterium sp. AOP35-5H-19]|uniref:4'-phosphopantetheinyl transferase family protein n=1 Tax=Brachybacterium sp. AOP35-5H-19 TaxID=3457685 RepID=UPI003FB6B13A
MTGTAGAGRVLAGHGRELGAWCSPDGRVELRWWIEDQGPETTDLHGWFAPAHLEPIVRLRRSQDRRTHLLAHTLARSMLHGRTGDLEAASIDHEPSGKPVSRCGLAVSLSHSARVVAAAVGDGTAVGVDVEDLARGDQLSAVRDVLCHPAELSVLGAEEAEDTDLFRLWVAKEALVKVGGTSLDRLHQVDLSLLLTAPAATHSTIGGSVSSWNLVLGRHQLRVWRDGSCMGALVHHRDSRPLHPFSLG